MQLKLLEEKRRGPLRVVRHPKDGAHYSIGADVSAGIKGGDYSAACVLDMETMEQVAWWHGYIDPRAFGRKLAWLGYYYNDAYITVEANNNGQATLYELKDLSYANLYRSIEYDKLGRVVQKNLGFWNDTKRRPMLWGLMRRTVLEGWGRINSLEQLDEMKHIYMEEPENNLREPRETHPKGKHDDLTVAWGLALIGRDAAYVTGAVEVKPSRPRDADDEHWEAFEREAAGEADPLPEQD